jgi:hypothetical protein
MRNRNQGTMVIVNNNVILKGRENSIDLAIWRKVKPKFDFTEKPNKSKLFCPKNYRKPQKQEATGSAEIGYNGLLQTTTC